MNGAVKKIAVAVLLSVVPLTIIVYKNFIQHGRGWHTMLIQYYTLFWVTRLVLTPFLVMATRILWQKLNNFIKLFFYTAIAFGCFNFLCWGISFVTCRLLAPDFDGRDINLLNTIRYESTPLNLIVYTGIVLIVFSWLYLERHKDSEKKTLVLEKSLADAKQRLLQTQRTSKEIPRKETAGKIAVKVGHKTFLVPVAEITCILANGPYVNIITESASYILKKTISELASELPVSFLRVHRSSIVNMEFVKEHRSLLNGDACLVLRNGKAIRSSRTYKESIRSILNND